MSSWSDVTGVKRSFYVASRASIPERSAMWREFRKSGVKIISSWIDEAGEGETEDYTELWSRIVQEIYMADCFVLYAEPEDFPLKGALVEAGIAIAMNKPVVVCLPNVVLSANTLKPVGSWIKHKNVQRVDDINAVLKLIAAL